MIGGEGDRTEAVHEDLIDAGTRREHVGVEVAVAVTRFEEAVQRGLEPDRRLGVRELRRRLAVDHAVVRDRQRIAARVGHDEDRVVREPAQMAQRDRERFEVRRRAAGDEDEAFFAVQVSHSRYQSSSTATFQSRQ